jgi:putative DNA methylase
MLSSKAGKEAYVEPVIDSTGYQFSVKVGRPENPETTKNGTSAGKRAAFRCLMSGTPISYDYIRNEGQSGRMGERMMAIVAEGQRGRVYIAPTPAMEALALTAKPTWKPEVLLPENGRDFKTPNYGLRTYGDLFTARQLVALNTFSGLLQELPEEVKNDAQKAGCILDGTPLCKGGGLVPKHTEMQ